MAATLPILLTIFFFRSTAAMAETGSYIVHMDLSAMPSPFSDHHSWFSATLSSVSGRKPEIIYSYTDSIHGFSALLTISELESLKRQTGYVSFTRDFPVQLHTTLSPQFIGLNPNSGIWPVSNYGDGVVIGFVDTGIWPGSASFHDEGISSVPSKWKGTCEFNSPFVCNKKLIGARVFNKGLLANIPSLRAKAKRHYSSPYDTIGHGTHVSAIAAGNHVKNASYFAYAEGTASGIAPRAHIAVYKAAWEEGIYSSDVVAAIDQAIQDGIDVISLSLGISFDGVSLEDDPIAVAAFAAFQKGVFVVASSGNDGPFYWSLINGAPWITTVASGTVGRRFEGILTLGNGVRVRFPSLYPGNFSSTQVPLKFTESCDIPKGNESSKNKIVVCNDYADVRSKLEQAQSTGAVAAVVITDKFLSEQETIRIPFPVAFVSSKHRETIKDYAKNDMNATAKLEFKKTMTGAKPAPEVERYSSRGPFPSCPNVLKPDIFAPGTLILSAWPSDKQVAGTRTRPLFSGFNLLTGTSMAAPHVSGVAALIKQVYPRWSPSAIKSAIMTTAETMDNTLGRIKDIGDKHRPANPLAIGAGHVNPNKALNPGLIYDSTPQDFINFLCHVAKNPMKLVKAITRSNLSNICRNPSPDLNYPAIIAYFTAYQDNSGSNQTATKVFRRTLTNVGEAKRNYSVRVRGLEGLNVVVEPKKLVFNEKYERLSYTVRLESPRMLLQENVIHGFVSWVDDEEGKYEVSCPVLATSLVQDS
ncbi:PREDICTED: subtilisin-like protease SBT1.9 [Tarenaya hassleriana]|uniref:subtilisin-like protease SBT1.9 n=1 Tax=Tarenaya hassleriana TaxID=28532 RepID=UPI00053C180F|nr:PREDICTED: subtilisin-like protease SBT1.9 [Tarenaya hassleriana]